MTRIRRSSFVAVLALGGMLGFSGGCATDAQTGGLIGAGAGAGIGALIGNRQGNTGLGAGIGAAAGGVGGYMIGNESDKVKRDRAYRAYY